VTRTHPTDDELADLLRDSFAAHEERADPDRAVAIAATEAARPGRGRVLVAAAAAVALVAGGTAYAVSRGSGPCAPVAGPRTPTSTPTGDHGPSLRTNAENHALAVAMAGRVAASLPAYPGAREATVGEVPPLKVLNVVSSPERYTVTRSRFWTVPGTPRTVAGWYASHPPAGFVSDGGPTGVGGESRPDGGWIDDVFLDQTPPRRYAPAGASILVQTTRLSDGSVGIRATVDAVWRPARPAASYVSDVRAVTVRTTVTTYGTQTPRVRHHTVRISSPDAVGALVTAYNALPGWPPFFHSCPMQQLQRTYRIVFHTASGDVSVSGPMSCYDVLTVRRDGRRVGPYLDLGSDLLAHLPQ
jgi:hypothetical protein